MNGPEIEAARTLNFGVCETTDRFEISAKVLYVAGLDTERPGFTSRNIRWKPRWGRVQPRVPSGAASGATLYGRPPGEGPLSRPGWRRHR